MCTLVMSYLQHPDYPLIVASNRDEFYHRPTERASFWRDHPNLLAGRDLQNGGTWLGITKSGRFSALTNVRDLHAIRTHAPSRGELVLSTLLHPDPDPAALHRIQPTAHLYNGFNLVTGTLRQLYYYSNVLNRSEPLHPGTYVMSNAFLNTPWPKSVKTKSRFEALIQEERLSSDDLSDKLFELMSDRETFPPEQLPDTGLSKEMEIRLSSTFIHTENYGTRCTTIMKVDQNGHTIFSEKTYEQGQDAGTTTHEFLISANLSSDSTR